MRAAIVLRAALPTFRTSANAGDQHITAVSSSLGESVGALVVFQTKVGPPITSPVAGATLGLCRYRKRKVRRNLSGKRRRFLNPPHAVLIVGGNFAGFEPLSCRLRPWFAAARRGTKTLPQTKNGCKGCVEKLWRNNRAESTVRKIVENVALILSGRPIPRPVERPTIAVSTSDNAPHGSNDLPAL